MATKQSGKKQIPRREIQVTSTQRPPSVEIATFPETDWEEKVARALEAKRASQEARKGKPVAFELVHSHIM